MSGYQPRHFVAFQNTLADHLDLGQHVLDRKAMNDRYRIDTMRRNTRALVNVVDAGMNDAQVAELSRISDPLWRVYMVAVRYPDNDAALLAAMEVAAAS